jgi:hypothetical protein
MDAVLGLVIKRRDFRRIGFIPLLACARQRLHISDACQTSRLTYPMAYENSTTSISLNDKVRFKEERLCVLTPSDRKRLEGRVGVVQSYWNFTRKLTVYFPEDSGRPELRILSVDARQLEQVAPHAVEPDIEPHITHDASGEERLSQEDMDNMFD